MSIALTAFILTLLFVPAVSFRMALGSVPKARELIGNLNVTDSLWVFSLVPIIVHLVLLILVELLTPIFDLEVKFDRLLMALSLSSPDSIDNYGFGVLVIQFLGYLITSIVLGFLLGRLIASSKWGNRFLTKNLGLGGEWYELFNGRMLERAGEEHLPARTDLVWVDALCQTKHEPILYSGFISKYFYKPKSTEIDYILLVHACRSKPGAKNTESSLPVQQDSGIPSGDTFEQLPGHFFLLPMREVTNLNIQYVSAGFVQ